MKIKYVTYHLYNAYLLSGYTRCPLRCWSEVILHGCRFTNSEESTELIGNKRQYQPFLKADQQKKMKMSTIDSSAVLYPLKFILSLLTTMLNCLSLYVKSVLASFFVK